MSSSDFNCPHCEHLLEGQTEMLGTLIICPSCHGAIKFTDPEPTQTVLLAAPLHGQAKACPYCGETIHVVARKCKHCGSMLFGVSRCPVQQEASTVKGRASILKTAFWTSPGTDMKRQQKQFLAFAMGVLALYLATYYAFVKPLNPFVLPSVGDVIGHKEGRQPDEFCEQLYLLPNYCAIDCDLARKLFSPIHRIDRTLRYDKWNPWIDMRRVDIKKFWRRPGGSRNQTTNETMSVK